MHYFILLLVYLPVITSNAITNTSMLSMILDNLGELCPGANICKANRTLQTQGYASISSCCTGKFK